MKKNVEPLCVPELGAATVRGEVHNYRAAVCKGIACSSHLPGLPCSCHQPLPPILYALGPLIPSQDMGLADQGQ